MRLFIATLSTETNTFCTMPTGMSGFEEYFLRHGDASKSQPNLMTEALHVWRRNAEALGWSITESLAAIAEPAGPTIASCYKALRDEILGDLEKAGGADIVLLQLHGAMISQQVEDCEGDIVACVRNLCPDAVIGISLDLHCHLTQKMMDACDLIICFKEYPHDDASDRAEELFDLAHRTAVGQIKPTMAMFDCNMINVYLTKTGAMRKFVDGMSTYEKKPGILSISLAHGFPWADVKDVGARMLAVTDDNANLAAQTAETLGKEFFDLRHDVTDQFVSMEMALDIAESATRGPVVLADMGDNSGGGAPGDATFLLRATLDRGLTNVVTGIFWDPVVVRICEDAGEGATLNLRIGGKTGLASGIPVDISGTVMKIADGLGQHLGLGLEPLGKMVWIRCENSLDIVVNDLRTQVYHPEALEQLGIDLSEKSIVCVKSMFHFFTPFQKIAAQIVQVATPGGTSQDFATLRYSKRDNCFWPKNSGNIFAQTSAQSLMSD
ncbi:M81 family metallopeptidase [uncultured Roseovarius sp.]|uniref:M81 family metallopeptidase n=1 Tax=uncultured Roseovarius sp. TaxID=293344 RepID=UPI002608DA09|nr:M81 family metallopeptidase [uncultured Roseovarius sp.]